MEDTKYFVPAGLDGAVQFLAEHGAKVSVLAGGTDLIPKINYYAIKPDIIMFIGSMGMNSIKDGGGRLSIGAGTSVAKLMESDLVKQKAPALIAAAEFFASPAVRTTATIGGNLVNASPAADFATPLLSMDAEVVLTSKQGARRVEIKDFFVDRCKSVLRPDELLTEIEMPDVKGRTVFLKLGRRKAMTLSVANAAVRVALKDGVCEQARIALGAMAPTPIRCYGAEDFLLGKELNESLIEQCAAKAVAESSPIDDQRASAWYRRQAANVILARALKISSGMAI